MIRRRVCILIAFLGLGAAVNIAVALGSAWHTPEHEWIAARGPSTAVAAPFPDHPSWRIDMHRTFAAAHIGRGEWLPVDAGSLAPAHLPWWSRARHEPAPQDYEAGGRQRYIESAYGWPLVSLKYDYSYRNYPVGFSGNLYYFDELSTGIALSELENLNHPNDWRKTIHMLPYGVIWPNTVINTALYAIALWLVLWWLPRRVKRISRLRRGRCPVCAYPIGTSPVCTECGGALPASVIQR